MKKLLNNFRWNDRTKLAVAAAATGAMLLFAILFPLTFRQSTPDDTANLQALDVRTQLFARYWNAEDTQSDISSQKIETPKAAMEALCAARMEKIIALSIPDQALEDRSPTGSEYTKITDGETELRVCRMWMEHSGDWKNWLDVCFDADTGELYYLYLSCACLTDNGAYQNTVKDRAEHLTETLAAYLDGELRLEDEKNGGRIAVITTPNGTVCYRVDCTVSEELIDVKINCI